MRAFLQSIRQSKNSDAVLIPELFDHLDRYTRRMREGYNSFSCVPPDTKMLKPLMPKGGWLYMISVIPTRDYAPNASCTL